MAADKNPYKLLADSLAAYLPPDLTPQSYEAWYNPTAKEADGVTPRRDSRTWYAPFYVAGYEVVENVQSVTYQLVKIVSGVESPGPVLPGWQALNRAIFALTGAEKTAGFRTVASITPTDPAKYAGIRLKVVPGAQDTPDPAAPTGVTLTNANDGTQSVARLQWLAVAGATAYEVRFNEGAVANQTTALLYDFVGFTPGVNYSASVRAVTGGGVSAWVDAFLSPYQAV